MLESHDGFLDRLQSALGADPPPSCTEFLARGVEVLGSDPEAWSTLFSVFPAGRWWASLTGGEPNGLSWPDQVWRSYGAPLEYLPTHILGVDGINYGVLLPAPEVSRELLGLFGYFPTDGDASFDRIAKDFPTAFAAFAASRAGTFADEELQLLDRLGIDPANHEPHVHASRGGPISVPAPSGYVSVVTADNLPFWVRSEHHDPDCEVHSEAEEDAIVAIERADAVASAGFPGTALIMLKNRSHLHLTDADAVGERASVLAAMAPHYRAIGREAYAERAREMSRSP